MGNIIEKKQKQLSRAVLNYRAYAYQLPYDFSEFLILNTGNESYDTAEFKAEMPFSQEYIIYMLMREVIAIPRRSSRPEEIVEEWLTGDEAVYGGCFCRNFTGGPLDIDTKCLNGKIPSGDHELLVLLIRINSAFNREEATLSTPTEEDIDRVTREFQKKLTEVNCRGPEEVEIISWCEKAVSTVSSYRKWLLREYVRVTLYKRIKGFMLYLVYMGRFGGLLRDRVKRLLYIDNLEISKNRLEDLRYDTVFKVCAESNYKKLNYVVIDTEIASATNKLLVTLGKKEFTGEMERKYQEVFRIRERLVRIHKTTYYALLRRQDSEEAYYEASAVVSRCESWITADMPETRRLLCQTNLLMTVRNEFFKYKDNGARDESTHLER
jgi:hypothetical protein